MRNGMGLTLNSMSMGMGSPMMSMESPIKKRRKLKKQAMSAPSNNMPQMPGTQQMPFGGILQKG